MYTTGLTHFEVLLLLLLIFVAGLAVLAKRIEIPYPIVLVVGGLFLSFLPGTPRIALDPEVIFLVFLPPLLFSASFHISWREFRENSVSIVMLAFGLVAFTLFGVAVATRYFLPGFTWKLGLVLGAVVATTDPLAATSTARRLGLPRSIVDLLESESLVNDGSGLLALRFTAAIVVTGVTPTFLQGISQLTYLICAGVAVGVVIGWFVSLVQRRISEAPIEITISLVTPYVTYLVAESAHCSGILATIACGLYLGRRSSGFYSLHARIESSAFWRTLDFILNGMVFLLLGLQLPAILADIHGHSTKMLILEGTLFSGVVIALRLLWVYPEAWISSRVWQHVLRKPKQPVSNSLIFLVGWAGMRGVLALAAALSLPVTLKNGQPFPQRSLIIFLTFCAIFATLVLQGLSMPTLIRRLGVSGLSLSLEEEDRARRDMIAGALEAINQMRQNPESSQSSLDAMDAFYRHELSFLESSPPDTDLPGRAEAEARRRLARELRDVERRVALELRNQDQIHDEVLRTLQRELDLLDARFASHN